MAIFKKPTKIFSVQTALTQALCQVPTKIRTYFVVLDARFMHTSHVKNCLITNKTLLKLLKVKK